MIHQFNCIENAIKDIREGKIVIVFDDAERENEGDFIAAAELVTPEIINFMAKNGRGLICAALTDSRCKELLLEPMVKENTALMKTNFTVTVDLIGNGCTTGISSYDRSKTIRALATKGTQPYEFGRPGHIFPLISHPQGVLGRNGHTEASVDLSRLAGLYPAGVLVEILNNDGSMARLDDLVDIAKKYSLSIISINQLREYIIEKEPIINAA